MDVVEAHDDASGSESDPSLSQLSGDGAHSASEALVPDIGADVIEVIGAASESNSVPPLSQISGEGAHSVSDALSPASDVDVVDAHHDGSGSDSALSLSPVTGDGAPSASEEHEATAGVADVEAHGAAIPYGECPACGNLNATLLFRSTDRLYATTDRTFDVVECAGCRLIRLSPWPSPSELRQYYPESYWFAPTDSAAGQLEEIYRRLVLSDHVRFVRGAVERCGERGPILDVGCGGGLFLRMVADRGHRVVGLDFSLDAAAVAWGRNGVPAVCATLSKAPFGPESCAAVTMFHVLEHLYDPASYLDAARELLKPEGRLIVQVPNAACWQFLLFQEQWNGIDVPRHLINFKESDVVSLLEYCGFEVVRRKHFSIRDNPAGLATTLVPSLDPMARRVRATAESPGTKLIKDLVYLAVVLAAVPFTMVEAACRAGSTIMIEARKKQA